MINKKAERESIGWLVSLIIVIVVILIAGGGLFLFLKYGGWKILPSFEDGKKDSIDDIIVEEGVVIKFEEPLKVRYLIKGEDAEGIYYTCNHVEGWKWYYEKLKKWRKVDKHLTEYSFTELSLKNKDFLISLYGKSCEEGLGLLVNRVNKNDEGRGLIFKSKVELKIFVGDKKPLVYRPGDEIFEDIRFLIKKINMVGRE